MAKEEKRKPGNQPLSLNIEGSLDGVLGVSVSPFKVGDKVIIDKGKKVAMDAVITEVVDSSLVKVKTEDSRDEMSILVDRLTKK